MQTLGLASEQKPTDGMFKRLLWPTIENNYDVELISRQGFWLCVVIAFISMLLLIFSGHWILGVFVGLVYLLAAIGVRERSLAGASAIFLCYVVDQISGMITGQSSIGLISVVSTMMLLANVRATLLARRWKGERFSEVEVETERVTFSLADKFANVMPPKVWPVARFLFFPLSVVLLSLTIVGTFMYPAAHRAQLEKQKMQEPQVITVSPTN